MVMSFSVVDEIVVNVCGSSSVSMVVCNIVVVCTVELIGSIADLVVSKTQLISFVSGFCNITLIMSISGIILIVVVNTVHVSVVFSMTFV
jgi:hypothetical protein